MEWIINKIKNSNSSYDFRLLANNNDFGNINFFKHSYFRLLVSLSSYLSKGVIYCNGYYKINFDKKVPAIFDFSITKLSYIPETFMTIDSHLEYLKLVNENNEYKINKLALDDTKIFSSLFNYEIVTDMNDFLNSNFKGYTHINVNNLYVTTGWMKVNNGKKYLVIDLIKYDNKSKKTGLFRCKILDKKVIDLIKLNKKLESYCILILKIDKTIKIKYITPVTFDEYLTYIYDLMLPYKYDFNDINESNKLLKPISYDDNDIERNAFAIDPTGSKDRDDAISCFYLKDEKITKNYLEATHIKLIVHISDTLSYIQPNEKNYYYHYCRYKCNTNYLDKFNLPMMDRILSEEKLSLDGDKNTAITINLIYKIIDQEHFIIKTFPEEVKVHRSKNVNVFGTTYKKFSESFGFDSEKGYDNKQFNKRFIINCNNKVERDFNEFIYEGKSMYPNNIKKLIANNLKHLYIYFVNSLNHTGKDTLIKIPSNLVREKHFNKSNIYLEFSPVDMWCHSLIEYTALESNIYFSNLMYLISINKVRVKDQMFIFDYKRIVQLNEKLGKKNVKFILDNFLKDKKMKLPYNGIYRNLFTSGKDKYYINKKIRDILVKYYKKNSDYEVILEKFINRFNYKYINDKGNAITLLKILLALRQVFLLDSSNNLEISNKLISPDLRMKANYDTFPISHLDVCSLLYTHATSPMRRFIDINVHHIIFNSDSRDYIRLNLDIEGLNNSVNTGKHIHSLVNGQRFLELIELNNNLQLTAKMLDDKRNLIGFKEIVNFYNFNESFKITDNKVLLKKDNYNFPILKKISKDAKIFNIFFHMLRKESENVRKKCQKFLEKLFSIKKMKIIC